jgi:hypothetical protein
MNTNPSHTQSVPVHPSALVRALGCFANACSLAAQLGLLAPVTNPAAPRHVRATH